MAAKKAAKAKSIKVKKVKLFQQANGYWRWHALGDRSVRLANTSKPYSNYPDAAANLVAVVDPQKRRIPIEVINKEKEKRKFSLQL